jgi:hypothetical protein
MHTALDLWLLPEAAVDNVLLLLLLLLLLQAYAAVSGPASSSLVQLLLQHGAPAGYLVGVVDDYYEAMAGCNPLHLLACWSPANSSSSSSSSSKKTVTGEDDIPAAEHAGVAEQIAAAELLLEQLLGQVPAAAALDVDVHLQESLALQVAVSHGAYDFAAWLISRGADVNLLRKADATRLVDVAVCWGHTEVACLLLEHGAEVRML